MNILAIESSCDETAAAIVQDGIKVLSSTIATSTELHEKTGGVVPEVAARKQLESIVPVIDDCLLKSNLTPSEIDAIAVTVGPGLIGSLLVGVESAKALAVAWNKPLIPVNHLVGHIYANFINTDPLPTFPAIALVVSGGHTDLVLLHGHNNLEYLGGTLDDAAGEAFDKTARLLNIKAYLGGPALSKKAAECVQNTLIGKLPRPKIHDNDFDFSFSGLKSAVRRMVEEEDNPIETVACEFENAVVDVLVKKTIKAVKKYNVSCLLLGGGVAANTQLRTRMKNSMDELNLPLFIPPLSLCGDNAIYIASTAYFNYNPVDISTIKANPSLTILD